MHWCRILHTMLFFATLFLTASVVYAAPSSGSCLCATTSNVNVRDAAGIHSHVITSMNRGECYIFNGGVLTKDGHIWYELQDVHGHHRAWAASEYLHKSSHSSCSGGGSSSDSGSSSFSSGIVSQLCLECICKQESGCRPIGCHWDVNSNSCGYFQIKQNYYSDCHSPGSSWQSCADDKKCSSQCIQNYMARYASYYGCPATCESYAREHNGGPNGCHSSSTLGYWRAVKSHAGCGNLV